MSKKILISSIGWEPRFQLGIQDIIKRDSLITDAILFHPSLYKLRTDATLNIVEKILHSSNICEKVIEIDTGNHVSSWSETEQAFSNLKTDDHVILDITTMPRHQIWASLHFLDLAKVRVQCVYYRPEKYGDWLSGDNGKSKLIFRHSGVAYPDRATCLLIFSGFDLIKVNQIIDNFEPAKIILVSQAGEQLNNLERCVKNITSRSEVICCTLDAYSDIDSLRNELEMLVKNDVEKYNVIATTVGPRCSAIALYALNKSMPDIGLFYTNSFSYNESYSYGIDLNSRFDSNINFQSRLPEL